MSRSRSLTRLGSLLRRYTASGTTAEVQSSASGAVADAASYVSKRAFSNITFRTNVLGGQLYPAIAAIGDSELVQNA